MGESQSGRVSWTGDSWVDLPPETRERARRNMIDRHRERGPLLAIVEVRVYEAGAEPQISFTHDCTLGVETDRETLAGVVARARDALAGWR
jgi:hypothetical protein